MTRLLTCLLSLMIGVMPIVPQFVAASPCGPAAECCPPGKCECHLESVPDQASQIPTATTVPQQTEHGRQVPLFQTMFQAPSQPDLVSSAFYRMTASPPPAVPLFLQSHAFLI